MSDWISATIIEDSDNEIAIDSVVIKKTRKYTKRIPKDKESKDK